VLIAWIESRGDGRWYWVHFATGDQIEGNGSAFFDEAARELAEELSRLRSGP